MFLSRTMGTNVVSSTLKFNDSKAMSLLKWTTTWNYYPLAYCWISFPVSCDANLWLAYQHVYWNTTPLCY